MRAILFVCLVVFVSETLCNERRRDDMKRPSKDKASDGSASQVETTTSRPRKQRIQAVIRAIKGSEVGGKGCERLKCESNQICISNRNGSSKPQCIGKKLYSRISRVTRGRNKLRKVVENVEAKSVHVSDQLLQRAKKMKDQVQKFEADWGKKQQQRLGGLMSIRTTKLTVPEPVAVMNDSPTTAVQDASCRQKDLDGMGQKLLDRFKVQQEEASSKHRKEKRNSTKKELHDFDECVCQATVNWEFQQLDTDFDGSLSERELAGLKGSSSDLDRSCVAAFFHACDHNVDASLTEKEWCCCFADVLPPCLTAQNAVPSILIRGQPSIIPGSFVPQCDDDGFFKPVQCDSTTGQCWCVDHNGRQINGTLTTSGSPNC